MSGDRISGKIGWDAEKLIANARALLSIDASGALVPHGIGGHARTIIAELVAALSAALPLLEGGKGEKAVQDELPLATPVPPVDWKAVYANEATKFRAETIRTSELTAMVKRCVSVLIDDHPPGPWSRGCIRCKIVEDAEELLARPINVAAIPLYTAPQPAAQQPAGDGGVDATRREEAPAHNLPDWAECSLRVANSKFIAKRVADGGYGSEYEDMLASELHRFIYEYDDADSYRSAWFLHRLELTLQEAKQEAIAALRANTEKSK